MRKAGLIPAVVLAVLTLSCSSGADERYCQRVLGECTQLGTVEYTCDLRFQNEPARLEEYKPGPRVVLYSAKAQLVAGVDLSDPSAMEVEVSPGGRDVTVTLPAPRILDVKLEPKDVNKEFEKVGIFRWRFTPAEKLSIRQKAEQELMEQVTGPNPRIPILSDAGKNARAEVELLLKATGRFDSVTVKFAGDEEVR